MSAAKHYLGIVWLLAFAASASAAPRAWLDRTQINEGDTVTLNIESESSDTPDFSVLESDFDLRGQSSQTQTTISNGSVTTRTLWAVALEPHRTGVLQIPEIGRASCRERVCQYVKIAVRAESLKKKGKEKTLSKFTK